MEGVLAYVTLFAGNFAPRSWAFCNGQILSIAQNTALFSLIGTTYGGNGQTTFALPDLQGRAAVSAGQGPGLSPYALGQTGGTENTTLITGQMAFHGHALNLTIVPGTSSAAVTTSPAAAVFAPDSGGNTPFSSSSNGNMAPYSAEVTTGITGNNVPFNNRNPYLCLNYIICLEGIFPSRN